MIEGGALIEESILIQSRKQQIIKCQIFEYSGEFRHQMQSRSQCFNVLQSQPVLVQLLIHPMHVSHQALVLFPILVHHCLQCLRLTPHSFLILFVGFHELFQLF